MPHYYSPFQRIASEWHGGQSSALYAFASTGKVVDGLDDEIRLAMKMKNDPELTSLQAFARCNEFTRGYIDALIWLGDPSGESDLEDLDPFIMSPMDIHTIQEECTAFQNENQTDLETYYQDYDANHAGHDFALTRNGHGAGFWDRGLGEVGHKLTLASKPYGEASLYVGDDGVIYV